MTSLFVQYEEDLSSRGFNNAMDPDPPIFTKSRKDFNPLDKITHVALSNKYMVLVMANNVLFRMNLRNPTEKSEINLNKYTQNKLANIFLDPTANHLLLTFVPKQQKSEGPELMYLSRKSDKLKSTTKFRGNEITAVAWNLKNESDVTTGLILLGTSKGLIFETEIVAEGEKFFSTSLEQYWKQVFDIGKNTDTPITALAYFQVIGTDKYVIFAATPNRLYYFTGRSDNDEKMFLQHIFQKYLNVRENETFIECESKLRYSRLQFWSETLTPSAFAWITEKGIYYGKIDVTDDNMSNLQDNIKKLEYPKPLYEDYSKLPKYPLSIVLTEFHILLAYSDSIKGMCLLNEDVVYEDHYNEAFGKLVTISKDPKTGDIWAFTEIALFKFRVHKEERNIWEIFCANNQFDLAKKYTRGSEASYNQVLIKEADNLFDKKQYQLSAERFAETQSSFEEICLKFIQVDEPDSLKVFLRNKLRTLNSQDKTQITMITLWVVELYLVKLEKKRLEGLEKSAVYDDIQKEFQSFLALPEVAESVRKNKDTIYELMQSHGDKNNLMKLTIVNKDFEQLIRQHIFKNNFHEALEVLKSQNNYELYYQFAPILMQEIPKYMVKTLIDQSKKLVPLRLLPALVSCNGEPHSLEAIRYLEFCITKLKNCDKAIHNFLVSLYAKYDSRKLMDYLKSQRRELGPVNYDVHFALRLCTEQNLTEACVELSGLLGLWESAVELALKVNMDLAKKMANMAPENDTELKKKLWLKIAQYVVSEKNDVKKAMEDLEQCDLIKIEDILPFFSDFVTIDHFKDAICNSLKEYNDYMQGLKDDMEEATKSAEQVREEILEFRNSYMVINSSDTCEICNATLMIRPFYLFPCHHKFHSDCLLGELGPSLGLTKKSRLADLERQLKALNSQTNADNLSTGSSGMTAKEQVKTEIDNIIASECLYCGENMIRNIDKPFIEDFEYEHIMKEWE